MTTRTVEDYLTLPYTIEVFRDDEAIPGWVARVVELPGCLTQGDTFEELGEMIEDAMRGWIEIALEDGIVVPEPRPDEDYSGKFVVRVPRSLHRRLVEQAEAEGVSLNQYINVALASATSRFSGPMATKPREQAAEQTNWPGLNDAVKNTLRTSGLQDEAGELDERLFADWISGMIGQVESACADEDYPEASRFLIHTMRILRQNRAQSPVIESMLHMLQSQHELIEQSQQMRQGIVKQTLLLKSQISQSMNKAFHSPPDHVQTSTPMRPKGFPPKESYISEQLDVTKEFFRIRDRDKDE